MLHSEERTFKTEKPEALGQEFVKLKIKAANVDGWKIQLKEIVVGDEV